MSTGFLSPALYVLLAEKFPSNCRKFINSLNFLHCSLSVALFFYYMNLTYYPFFKTLTFKEDLNSGSILYHSTQSWMLSGRGDTNIGRSDPPVFHTWSWRSPQSHRNLRWSLPSNGWHSCRCHMYWMGRVHCELSSIQLLSFFVSLKWGLNSSDALYNLQMAKTDLWSC